MADVTQPDDTHARAVADRAAADIDAEEVAALAVELGAIESAAGIEGEAAERVAEWLAEQGFAPRRLGLIPERPSIVARLDGQGSGPTLVFNAHLDTAVGREDTLVYRDPAQRKYLSAWREGDTLFGNGLVNDKAPMAAFLVAAAQLRRSGIQLSGDVVLTAVPGEIGLEPMDEFQGTAYLGKDLGARFMIARGIVGDAALVAEATGNTMGWVEAGKAYFRIQVHGGEPLYTPFVPPEPDPLKSPNALVRLGPAVIALNEWAAGYAERVFECPGGTVVPKANITAVRGGRPEKMIKSTQLALLYLDVRLVPDANVLAIRREIAGVLDRAGVPADVECVMYRRGYEAQDIGDLVGAVRSSHVAEFGDEPARPAPPVTSMWRDTNPFNEAGIPSLTYGPASSTGGGNFSLTVAELARTARVYARTMVAYCGPTP